MNKREKFMFHFDVSLLCVSSNAGALLIFGKATHGKSRNYLLSYLWKDNLSLGREVNYDKTSSVQEMPDDD